MSFTDQKPHVVTEEDVRASWGEKTGKAIHTFLGGK